VAKLGAGGDQGGVVSRRRTATYGMQLRFLLGASY
jgi:hypothetical protein